MDAPRARRGEEKKATAPEAPKAPIAAGLLPLVCAIWWLLRGTPLIRGAPDSLVCRPFQRCHIYDLAEWHLRTQMREGICLPEGDAESLLGHLQQRIEIRSTMGSLATVVFIGPGDLNDTMGASFVQLVKGVSGNSSRFVFVEPNPRVLPALLQQLEVLGLDPNQTLIVNAAVCLYDESQALYHAFADRLFEEFPSLRFLARNAALERDAVVLGHLFQDSTSLGFSTDMWTSMLAYVEEMRVRCLAPQTLLREAGLAAGEVDMLIMNTAGDEPELVGSFLQLDGFAPASVFFDWLSPHLAMDILTGIGEASEMVMERLYPAINLLTSRGYSVYQCTHNLLSVLVYG